MTPEGWQPIDTAPSDTPVLIHSKPWGVIVAVHSAEHDQWLSRMQVPVSLATDEDQPTHWHALPEAPEEGRPAARDGTDGPG